MGRLETNKKGYSIGRLFCTGSTLVLCYLCKDTAWFTFLLIPLVLILALLRGRFTWLVISASILGILNAALTMLEWNAPLGWYQSSAQTPPLRVASPSSPLGNYIFQSKFLRHEYFRSSLTNLNTYTVRSIRGQTVTLGAWFWANQVIQIISPYMIFTSNANGTLFSNSINSPQTYLDLNTTPTFYRFVIQVPNDASFATLFIPYVPSFPDNKIFVDGLVLVPGKYSDTPPHFADPNGTQGTWDDSEFRI